LCASVGKTECGGGPSGTALARPRHDHVGQLDRAHELRRQQAVDDRDRRQRREPSGDVPGRTQRSRPRQCAIHSLTAVQANGVDSDASAWADAGIERRDQVHVVVRSGRVIDAPKVRGGRAGDRCAGRKSGDRSTAGEPMITFEARVAVDVVSHMLPRPATQLVRGQ
jgi:hypothetical protein